MGAEETTSFLCCEQWPFKSLPTPQLPASHPFSYLTLTTSVYPETHHWGRGCCLLVQLCRLIPHQSSPNFQEHGFNNTTGNPRREDGGAIFPRAFSILGIWLPNYSLLLDNIRRSSQASRTHPLLCLLGKHCLLCPSLPSFPDRKCSEDRHLEREGSQNLDGGLQVAAWASGSTPAHLCLPRPGLGPGQTAPVGVLIPAQPPPHGTVLGHSLSLGLKFVHG